MSLNIKPFDMKTIVINKDASGNSVFNSVF